MQICGFDNGKFLLWAIETLSNLSKNCQACSGNANLAENGPPDKASEDQATADTDMHDEFIASTNTKQTHSSSSNTSEKTGSQTHQWRCVNCESCNDQLEQLFCCLFGYKKLRVKYLSMHSTTKIEYTLENSIHLYNYFKPSVLPEYDSVKSSAIPSEVREEFK